MTGKALCLLLASTWLVLARCAPSGPAGELAARDAGGAGSDDAAGDLSDAGPAASAEGGARAHEDGALAGAADGSAAPDAARPAPADAAPSPGAGLEARIEASALTGPAPLRVELSGCGSTARAGAVAHFAWDLGDGEAATGSRVAHVYSAGEHHVRLTITAADGAQATAAVSITVTAPGEVRLVTNPAGHPRLYFDAAHKDDLLARIASTPILGAPARRASYVDGYLLTNDWQSAGWYVASNGGNGCRGLLSTAFQGPPAQNPVSRSRAISDCLSTIAGGAALQDDPVLAAAWARSAIDAMLTMANVWPRQGASNAGFGRWQCGACLDNGSNLNNGELLYAVALSFDLLHDRMSDAERRDIRDLLIREARFTYGASIDTRITWWSRDTGNNWQAVVHGGLGVAALALRGESGLSPGEADTWIERSVERTKKYLDTNFDEDGVNYEDSDHTAYGLMFATHFAWALENVTGRDDLFAHRGQMLKKAARYRVLAVDAPFDGQMPNDGTGRNPTTYPTDLLLAAAYRDGFSQWLWDRVSGASRPASNEFPFKVGGDGAQSQLVQTALSHDPTVPIESPEGRLPLGRVFPGFGRALFRSSYEDPRGISFGAECGIYGSHGKPNQGHFFLSGFGEALTNEDAYNIVRIDGRDQRNADSFRILCSTTSWLDTPAFDVVSYDTARAYDSPPSRAERRFVFARPSSGGGRGWVAVLDRIEAASSRRIAAELHPGRGFSFGSAGGDRYRATKSGSDVTLDVVIAAPEGAEVSTAGGLIVTREAAHASFAALLVPGDATHAAPALSAVRNGTVAAGARAGDDLVLYNPTGARLVQDGAIRTDARVLVVRGRATAPERVLVVDASFLEVGSERWLSSPSARVTAEIERSGTELLVARIARGDGRADARVSLGGAPSLVSIDAAPAQIVELDAAGSWTMDGGLPVSGQRTIELHGSGAAASCP